MGRQARPLFRVQIAVKVDNEPCLARNNYQLFGKNHNSRFPDIEVLGVLSSYILEKKYTQRIDPNLTFHEVHQFVMLYYERCLIEDPEGEWTDSDYEAAWSLVNWFKYLWSNRRACNKEVANFKSWLGSLYKTADSRVQSCLVNGIIEHLFEDKQIRSFFKDWEKDTVSRKAYNEGLAWRTR